MQLKEQPPASQSSALLRSGQQRRTRRTNQSCEQRNNNIGLGAVERIISITTPNDAVRSTELLSGFKILIVYLPRKLIFFFRKLSN
jgi:hypothetical protein